MGRAQEGKRHLPRRSRDRHGRGMRGSLAPPDVPLSRTPAETFDDLVLDAVEHLEDRWSGQLAGVEFAVEDVPPVGDSDRPDAADQVVPLARLWAAHGQAPARIVVYRRPLEVRAGDREDLADLVHDVVVERVAELLGLEPDTVDPGYGE